MSGIVLEKDNSAEVLRELEQKIKAALTACGQQAQSYASQNVDAAGRVDTGDLMNSMESKVQDDTCYVGTNVEYAAYHEVGTGIYAGGSGWWVYVAGGGGGGGQGKRYTREQAARIVAMMQAKGIDAHMTQGVSGIHFLKNALANHVSEYQSIIEEYLNK